MTATSWGPPSWPPSTWFYLEDLATAARHAQLAAQRLDLDRQRDMRLDGPFPLARRGEHGARRCALDHVREQVSQHITTAWWELITDVLPGAVGAYARAAEIVLRAVTSGQAVPSAAELESALDSSPFTPPPLPDLDDLLPQRDTRDEQALRHHHVQLAQAYQVARIPPEHRERMRPQDYPAGREHRPPPEVDEHGGSLAWFAHRELPDTVIVWATVMDRAARRTAGINDAIAASEDGSYWVDQ